MHIQYNDLYSHDQAKDPDNNEIINLGRAFLFSFLNMYKQTNNYTHKHTKTYLRIIINNKTSIYTIILCYQVTNVDYENVTKPNLYGKKIMIINNNNNIIKFQYIFQNRIFLIKIMKLKNFE